MKKPIVLQVALKVPFAPVLDYLVPEGLTAPEVGARVLVSLAKRQPQVGVVMAVKNSSKHKKLKAIEAVLDQQPLLDASLMQLLSKTANYYQAPLGEVVHMALPRWFRQPHNKPIPSQKWWRCCVGKDEALAAMQRSEKQQQLFAYLMKNQPLQSKDMVHVCSQPSQVLKVLAEKGLVESSELCFLQGSTPNEPGFELTDDQASALDVLSRCQSFSSHLLDGITGSGKTEVYIRLIQQHIKQGHQVLVMVPEIGLTPQLFSEISERISGRLAVLHSGLSDGARARVWQQSKAGQVDVVVATRSGVYAPFRNLSLIVVDEEHDLSYKQHEGIRYSARDLALLRGQLTDVPVVLGSATPSMETLFHAANGKHQWHRLRTRTNQKPLPKTVLLNTTQHSIKHGLCRETSEKIKKHLALGQQVLVFLNRRGWSPKWVCHDCGWVAECDDCDVYLTYHKHKDLLSCHHCDRHYSTPEFCPDCGSQNTDVMGVGTERVAAGLAEDVGTYPVLRFDRDTVKSPKDWQKQLAVVRRGEPCVIVGTQMLAKGHDFPELSLVVVVNVDNSFFSTDFRATEHLAQLLVQVSGRAGRAHTQGEVIIQTQNPSHEFFTLLLQSGYQAFAQQQLKEREALQFPPFSHMAIIHAQHRSEHELGLQLLPVIELATDHPDVVVLGPIPAPIQRKHGLYRNQIIINANHRKALHQYIHAVRQLLPSSLSWIVDIDPLLLDG